MNVERRAASALKWTAMARLVGQAASWVVTLVVVRILSPADYGLMALVTVILSIAANVAELGLSASVVQARELDPVTVRQLSGFLMLLHLAFALLVAAAAPLAAWVFDADPLTGLIQIAALQFVFIAIGAMPHALATRAMAFKWLAQIEFATGVVTSLATLALAIGGFEVWSLVLGGIVGHALRAVLLLAGGERVRPVFRFDRLAEHLRFGSRLAASRLIWTVVSQADIMIGGKLLTRDGLGAYSVAMHLATLPMQKVMSVVNQVAFPAVAQLQEERERLRLRLLQSIRLLTAVGIPTLWGLSAVAPDLVLVVFGSKWHGVAFPLQVVTLVVPLRMVAALMNTAVAAVGHAGADLRNMLITAIVWPLCFAVGSHWGPDGLALSWLLAVPLSFALNFHRTVRPLGLAIRAVAGHVRVPVLAGAAMYAAVWALKVALADASEAARLPALIAAGAALYVPLVLVLDRRLGAEGRQLLSALRR